MQRCKNCGEKIIRFPIWEGQERGEPFSFDKILWLNLIKVDLMTIIWIAVIIFMIVSYKSDISKCEEMVTDPLGYCEDSKACKVLEERRAQNPYGAVDISEMPEIDINMG